MTNLIENIHRVADVYTNMHFVYTGDAHGDGYVNYRGLGKPENAPVLERSVVRLIEHIIESKPDPYKRITVIGPETLGAQMVTLLRALPQFRRVVDTRVLLKGESKGTYVWHENPSLRLGADRYVVFMDDLLNAGSTFSTAKTLVREQGSRINAIAVIGDRSGLSPFELEVDHVASLEQFRLNRYDLSEGPCPLCLQGVPIVRRPGHGHQYEKDHPDYGGRYIDL